MPIVVDFAWTKPTVAQLQSWGAVAAGMYVSHDPTKNATAALVREYAAAGIKTFLFFEDAANNAAGGAPQGHADAPFALAEADGVGMPPWAPVIASMDFDVPDYAPNSSDPMAKLGPVGQYLQAWCNVLGKGRVAVYGDFYVCERAINAGVATYAVQTIAWSGGQQDLSQIALYQNGQQLDNGNVDIETIVSEKLLDLIAWTPGEANPVVLPPYPAPKGLAVKQLRNLSWESVGPGVGYMYKVTDTAGNPVIPATDAAGTSANVALSPGNYILWVVTHVSPTGDWSVWTQIPFTV